MICAGGGGIPTTYTDDPAPAGRRLRGVEAVIDKDLASALLAIEIGADALLIVTDVDAVYADWGTPEQRPIRSATPEELAASEFAAGSMGPKVRAACWFAEQHGRLRRDRLDRRHPGAAAGRGRHARRRRGRRVPRAERTQMATTAPAPATDDPRGPHVARPLERESVARGAGRRARRGPRAAGGGRAPGAATGPTSFAEAKTEPRWHAFLRQYQDPMQIVLLVAGVISIYPVKQPGTGIMILLLTLLNAVLGLNQEGKAAAAVAALAKMMIVKARVRRDGALAQLPAEELVPGRRGRDRGRRRRARRRARARGGDARGGGGGADRREPARGQGRRARSRRPTRRSATAPTWST